MIIKIKRNNIVISDEKIKDLAFKILKIRLFHNTGRKLEKNLDSFLVKNNLPISKKELFYLAKDYYKNNENSYKLFGEFN